MTIEERAAQAAQYKETGACNCTQAVIKVFEDKISTDEKELMELTAGFVAGMGSLESTCGALIGAVMTAGVLTEGKGTPRFSREILQKFSEKSGATICKELKVLEPEKSSASARNVCETRYWHWERRWGICKIYRSDY